MLIDLTIYDGNEKVLETKATGSGSIHKAEQFVRYDIGLSLQELKDGIEESGMVELDLGDYSVYFIEAISKPPKPKVFKDYTKRS